MEYYSQINNYNFNRKKTNALNLISEIISFGIFENEILKLVEICNSLYIENDYFKNMIHNLESTPIYYIDDIYILEDIYKIRNFLKKYN
jgi:hypothetical protein